MLRPSPRIVTLACLAFAGLAPTAPARDDAPRPAGGFDFVHVPADAPVVIAFRPAALLALPDVKALYEELTRDPEVRRAVDVAEPGTIAQVTIVLARRDVIAANGALNDKTIAESGMLVVKTTKPREWKALAAAGGLPLTRATRGDKEYYRLVAQGDGPMFCAYQPDATTVVVAEESTLHKLLEGALAGRGEGEVTLPGDGHAGGAPLAVVGVDHAWVREMAAPVLKAADPQAALGLSVIGPIWEQTERLAVGLSMAEDGTTTLVVDHLCRDEGGAERVEDTLDALLTLGRNVAPEGLKLARKGAGGEPLAADLLALGETALAEAEVGREGVRVRLEVEVKIDLAKLVREAMKAH